MDWSKLPDIMAVALLAAAFASVARRSYTRVSGIWLTGWILIALHFAALVFLPVPGIVGVVASLVELVALTSAGVLFMWASVPYRSENSSRWMLVALLTSITLYLCAIEYDARPSLLRAAAVLLGCTPLAVALAGMRRFNHPLRWATVVTYLGLSAFLLSIQNRPNDGPELALNGVLFAVYFGCCIHFWYAYRRATAGAFITIYGFFTWSFVFVAAPLKAAYFPAIQVESEVWNLPKYVVAVGMILLLLEEQIDHNKHLALHDVLTGLPNRRLFQDRLTNAVERARRSGSQAALLVLDLDQFKSINDTMGHHMGDLVLQRVAKVFGGRVRRSDTVARTGGDEFSVILEGPTTRAEALHVGRSLQELLKEPLELEDRKVKIGASFGLAVFPDDAPDIDSLFIAADLRMYENKRSTALAEDPYNGMNRVPADANTAEQQVQVESVIKSRRR